MVLFFIEKNNEKVTYETTTMGIVPGVEFGVRGVSYAQLFKEGQTGRTIVMAVADTFLCAKNRRALEPLKNKFEEIAKKLLVGVTPRRNTWRTAVAKLLLSIVIKL